jgi:prepilin-type N-terminal cleavage/methylation domain-containing protein
MKQGSDKTKHNKKQKQGFTLIETLVTLSIFFVVLFSVYIMIVHFSNATKTEQAQNQA